MRRWWLNQKHRLKKILIIVTSTVFPPGSITRFSAMLEKGTNTQLILSYNLARFSWCTKSEQIDILVTENNGHAHLIKAYDSKMYHVEMIMYPFSTLTLNAFELWLQPLLSALPLPKYKGCRMAPTESWKQNHVWPCNKPTLQFCRWKHNKHCNHCFLNCFLILLIKRK